MYHSAQLYTRRAPCLICCSGLGTQHVSSRWRGQRSPRAVVRRAVGPHVKWGYVIGESEQDMRSLAPSAISSPRLRPLLIFHRFLSSSPHLLLIMSNITEEPPSTDLITLTRWVPKEMPSTAR